MTSSSRHSHTHLYNDLLYHHGILLEVITLGGGGGGGVTILHGVHLFCGHYGTLRVINKWHIKEVRGYYNNYNYHGVNKWLL